ncbi:MAG: hypothetical protein ABMA25_15030, partial [Ilumatobacteraceae bacterium]
PKTGMALLFQHRILHEGAVVTSGTKYVLRTDVIAHAQPDSLPPFHPKQPVALGEGLYVCGDHRDTPSIQGALFSGRRTAESVLAAG